MFGEYMKFFHLVTVFTLMAMYSANATASDFAALGVVLGGGVIMVVNVFLGIWACTVAKKKGHTKALPILGVIVFLIFIGIKMISGEANHMADSDTAGMINIILWPGILSFIAPFFIRKNDHE